MKASKFYLLLVIVALSAAGGIQAAEVVWLKLKPRFSYRDIHRICSVDAGGEPFALGAEVDGDMTRAAVLMNGTHPMLVHRVKFTAEEMSSVEWQRDSLGRLWLKRLPLNARLLNWVFFNMPSASIGYCRPSEPLATLGPNSFAFIFEANNLGELGAMNLSSNAKFQGRLKGGGAYEAELSWRQKDWQESSN